MKMSRVVTAVAACLLGGAAAASTVIGLSVEDQARLSRMVVLGDVVSQQGVDDPARGIETAVTLRVRDVLKGDVRPAQTVVFHTRGGEAGGVISEAEGEAVFRTGQTALVFVEDVEGRLYNLGLSMGVWSVEQEGGAVRSFSRFMPAGLDVAGGVPVEYGPIAYRDMVQRVRWTLSHPEFDNPVLRDGRLAGR